MQWEVEENEGELFIFEKFCIFVSHLNRGACPIWQLGFKNI